MLPFKNKLKLVFDLNDTLYLAAFKQPSNLFFQASNYLEYVTKEFYRAFYLK
jgi:hypothetical protein